MQTIEATYEIVTPMFIGGADPNEVELRPPSIKGALRFWWRALHWGQCLQATKNDPNNALKLLHQEEAELFGAAAKDKTTRGQSSFLIKLTPAVNKYFQNEWPRNNDGGAGYLGYGLDSTEDKPHRKAIDTTQICNKETKQKEPPGFKLTLVLRKELSEDQKTQLKQALKLWGLLGGLGSRARRGFGSVNLTELDGNALTFPDIESYKKEINNLLTSITLAPPMPIFTALSTAMKIVVIKNDSHPTDYKKLMDQIGQEYKTARKTVSGLAREVYGLPLEGLSGRSDKKNRRSSPLLLHIHKINNNNYIGVFSFIPAEFHPKYPAGKDLAFYETIDKYMGTMTSIYPCR